MKEYDIVRAGIGREFQTPSIYEDLTVFENLEILFPRGRSVSGALAFRRDAEVRDRVEEVARTIFLADHLDQYAELLSHGQKTVAGDRHAAHSGAGLDDVGRTGGRYERQ